MSKALEDLLFTFEQLRELAKGLGSLGLGSNRARSKEVIQLNGMHVVAFAAIEDFVRRRAIEVIEKIGSLGVRFSDFPEAARLFLLNETIAGIDFSVERIEAAQKINFLQHEGMLLGLTSDVNVTYEPSQYVFGRSSSNISTGQIKSLFEAMGMTGGLKNLTDVALATALMHLGIPDVIYTRLATNRHRAAHGFHDGYEVNQFISDLNGGALLFAFCFDTCLSQVGFNIVSACNNNLAYSPFSASQSNIRKVEFNPVRKAWIVLQK